MHIQKKNILFCNEVKYVINVENQKNIYNAKYSPKSRIKFQYVSIFKNFGTNYTYIIFLVTYLCNFIRNFSDKIILYRTNINLKSTYSIHLLPRTL